MISLKQFFDIVLGVERCIALEINDDALTLFGLVKKSGKVTYWLSDSIPLGKDADASQDQKKNTLQQAIARVPQLLHVAIILVLPRLAVLVRKKDGAVTIGTDSHVITVSDQGVVPDMETEDGIYVMIKSAEIEEWLERCVSVGIHPAAIVKGAAEWPAAFFVQQPETIPGKCAFILSEDSRMFITKTEHGRCMELSSLSMDASTVVDDAFLMRANLCFNHNGSNHGDSRYPVQWICNRAHNDAIQMCMDRTEHLSGLKKQIPWLDDSFVVAAGAAFAYFLPQFSQFNFLPEPVKRVNDKRRQSAICRRIFLRLMSLWAGATLFMLVLSLLFSVLSGRLQHKCTAVSDRAGQVQQLKKFRKELLNRRDKLAALYARKSHVGKILYCLSEVMPPAAVLTEISYDTAVKGVKKDTDTMLLQGYAQDTAIVTQFLDNLENHASFSSVRSQLIQEKTVQEIPAHLNSAYHIHFIIEVVPL